MIYFKEPYVTITWDEAIECVIVEWHGFVKSDLLKVGSEKSLELLKEQKATKYVANMQDLAIFSKEDEEWISQNWFPRAIEAGLRSFASLMPNSALMRMAGKSIKQQISVMECTIAHFSNETDAKDWLRTR
jgi:hypothetical protein